MASERESERLLADYLAAQKASQDARQKAGRAFIEYGRSGESADLQHANRSNAKAERLERSAEGLLTAI